MKRDFTLRWPTPRELAPYPVNANRCDWFVEGPDGREYPVKQIEAWRRGDQSFTFWTRDALKSLTALGLKCYKRRGRSPNRR